MDSVGFIVYLSHNAVHCGHSHVLRHHRPSIDDEGLSHCLFLTYACHFKRQHYTEALHWFCIISAHNFSCTVHTIIRAHAHSTFFIRKHAMSRTISQTILMLDLSSFPKCPSFLGIVISFYTEYCKLNVKGSLLGIFSHGSFFTASLFYLCICVPIPKKL